MFLATTDPGVTILLTCIFVLATIGIGVLLAFLIKKNVEHFKEEDDVIADNVLPKTQLVKDINKYIKKIGSFGAATLIYIDIDDFTDINEIFGTKAGDEILRNVAVRILRSLPYRASICKYKNDEFLVFIKNEDNRDTVEKLCNNILSEISKPIPIQAGDSINLTASIGVCYFPQAGTEWKELINNLELTTYVSKRDGGNKLTNYYATLSDDELQNIEYYKEIKEAIHKKEFELYYQPIIDLENHVIYGAEALMRWNHPTKGVQSPATFLKVLEQSGDIKWVGEWGMETMIRMHNSMAEKFPTIPLRFSLNLSTKQLLDPQLANSFIEIMNKNQAKPEWFMLEVNDFMMVERIAVIKTNIYKLRDYGFKIAVDGFELDGQSVQNIQKSPVDVIKLGRNFLKDVENNFMKERFLQILVKYAEDNNKELISEGIETAEITKYVKEQNVFLGQGYYFAKPLSEEAFEEYIEKRQYQVLLDDVSALEDNEALFKEMHSDDVVVEEEHEETPEEYLDRISRETHANNDNDDTEGDDLLVSDPSDDDLLV